MFHKGVGHLSLFSKGREGMIITKYPKEDRIKIVNKKDLKFIRMQFTDIFGALKKVAITPSQWDKAKCP